ncbi:envelope glycoprotein K [Saimiriine alphaherpesvirus 1]|uniref:Envelope glycoprotein K n=1 Tax=Saimiriine herpesvirus 1 (strain MV-5-4-PSL) TaxID=10353 RepID=E2IUB7_SHV1|nr:envelope glycoprotein K [Saimiriine alphaherpesvirus 1]ADO13775.1 envelope glycoprotein K [Saimiriine alphaherpesvirus 1]
MLSFGGREHCLTLILLSAYVVALAWYIVAGITGARRCIYAVSPPSSPNSGGLAWTTFNHSALFVFRPASQFDGIGDPAVADDADRGMDHSCLTDVVDGRALSAFDDARDTGRRLVLVRATRNCLRPLWFGQLRLVVVAWFLYAIHVALHQRRRMFGVVSPPHGEIPPATYLLNYAARIICSAMGSYPYTKMAQLMCELSLQRRALAQIFQADPVTFLHHRPTIGIAVACEALCRLSAQALIASSALLSHGECARAYPLFLALLTWGFVAVIALVEACRAWCWWRRRGVAADASGDTEGKRSTRPSGLNRMCGRCCATVLSGIVMRLVYLATVVAVVVVALRYEQDIQQRIFGA